MDRLDNFTADLKDKAGDNLVSFMVYGSAASGDTFRNSDINTMLILKKADPASLRTLSAAIKKWAHKGFACPMIFTEDRVLSSADIFPIEFMDIKDSRKIMAGTDCFRKVNVKKEHLRLEIERELKSNLLRLRKAYVINCKDRKKTRELMRDSLSTFLVIFRAILRLKGRNVPIKKSDLIKSMQTVMKLNTSVFSDILALKEGKNSIKDYETDSVFSGYMYIIEKFRDLIDKK